MNIGALASGISQGIGTGVQLTNSIASRENEARRLGIAEKGAALDQEVKQRQVDKDKRQEAVYSELAGLVEQAGGAPAGPEAAKLTPEQRVSFGLHRNAGLMRNPQFLNAAAGLFMKAGMPEGVKWLEHAHGAAKENAIEMSQALLSGDPAGALKIYNAGGQEQAQNIEPLMGEDGKPTGKYKVTLADGSGLDLDPKALYRSMLSPSEFFKSLREEEESAARVDNYKANAEYLRGRNPTAENVAGIRSDATVKSAETRADATVTAAEIRGAGRGRGRGTGKPEDRAKWMEGLDKALPMTAAVDADGLPLKDDMGKPLAPVVDKTLAPGIRNLARLNDEKLEYVGVSPQEAAETFGDIVSTFKSAKDPASVRDALDQRYGLAFRRDGAGDATAVAVKVGVAQDGAPILVRLTDAQQKALLADDARRRQSQSYDTEKARMLKRTPAPPAKPKEAPRPGPSASGKIIRTPAANGINGR